MTRTKAALSGLFAGLIAVLAMTSVMLFLAWKLRIATPLVLIGDRLSVFIPPVPFLSLMGRVGGYNHLKQLGVGSTIAGQLLVGAIGGLVYGLVRQQRGRVSPGATLSIFVLLPVCVSAILLWPVLGTHYAGLPIDAARLVTLLTLTISFLVFERTLVLGFNSFVGGTSSSGDEFSPALARRSFLFGIVGLLLAGSGLAAARRLFRLATFSYDGLQHKGPAVQPITPNEQFYCVTKNVVDPRVDEGLWHLEVCGLVQNPRTYRLLDFKTTSLLQQETTLMCISNGLDAGLMSNAIWEGVPLGDLLSAAGPLNGAARVKMHGVDNYSDTIPLEKAMEANTMVAFKMNGAPLPHRHGFPARAIVPGYFGEKHVKWLTRIEVTKPDAKGFYETQGWGPDFIVPIRSRIDVPANDSWIKLNDASKGVTVRGVGFAGDRGVSRVELSFDDGESWEHAEITYPGTKLSWALWRFHWRADEADDYILVVRAIDGDGKVQAFDPQRPFTSGVTGFHKVVVHVFA